MSPNATDRAGSPPVIQTWTWTSDAFAELSWLQRFGDQGWEVERVDGLARFVSHRPASGARRWEYRRATVAGADGRRLAGELIAEGWEPCGNWLWFQYFKRPAAEGVLDVLPPVPSRHVYWSGRFSLFVLLIAVLLLMTGFTGLSGLIAYGY